MLLTGIRAAAWRSIVRIQWEMSIARNGEAVHCMGVKCLRRFEL